MDYNKMTKAELIAALESLQSPKASEHPAGELQHTMHELQVHQIELEMQNRECRETQQALEESRKRYADLYDSAPIGYATLDDQGCFVEINLAGASMLGMERSWLIGKPFIAFLVKSDINKFREHLQQCRLAGEKVSTEVSLAVRNGEVVQAQLVSVAAQEVERQAPRYGMAMIDITARKRVEELRQAKDELELRVQERTRNLSESNEELIKEIAERRRVEQELRKSEERFRSLIQTAGSVILCLSPDGRILEWNLEAERVYGWKREEVLGKDYFELFLPAGIRETVVADMQKVLAGESTRNFENPILTRDGRTRLLSWNAVCLRNEQNQSNGVICIGQDITGTKNLLQAAQRMERLAALGQFAATLAHELRNLVGSIILNFDNLAEQLKNSERHKKTFNNIEQGIARIQNLINGVLDFARPAPPVLEKANLQKVLDRSLQAVKHELERAGITIQKNYAAIQPYVWLDANQIMQVFVNLFLNAKDAMYAGGNLTINTTCSESGIEVHIADSGKGISPENLEKIFDPFFTTRPEGIGLGLAVVARILEQHQAHILVESKAGVGTKFVIKFSPVMKHDNEP